jgi:hypothetical protein
VRKNREVVAIPAKLRSLLCPGVAMGCHFLFSYSAAAAVGVADLSIAVIAAADDSAVIYDYPSLRHLCLNLKGVDRLFAAVPPFLARRSNPSFRALPARL